MTRVEFAVEPLKHIKKINKYFIHTHTHTLFYYLSIPGQMSLGDICAEGDNPSFSLLAGECQFQHQTETDEVGLLDYSAVSFPKYTCVCSRPTINWFFLNANPPYLSTVQRQIWLLSLRWPWRGESFCVGGVKDGTFVIRQILTHRPFFIKRWHVIINAV